jgi:uncharacterized protein YacL (UPF0231 family)
VAALVLVLGVVRLLVEVCVGVGGGEQKNSIQLTVVVEDVLEEEENYDPDEESYSFCAVDDGVCVGLKKINELN